MDENQSPIPSQDELANKLFDAPYTHLSAWGQNAVDRALNRITALSSTNKVAAPYNVTLDTTSSTLMQDNERLASLVEQLQIENAELWEENGELKSQLERR
jgi:hypothetical protein